MSWSLLVLDRRKIGGKTTDQLSDVTWVTKYSPPQFKLQRQHVKQQGLQEMWWMDVGPQTHTVGDRHLQSWRGKRAEWNSRPILSLLKFKVIYGTTHRIPAVIVEHHIVLEQMLHSVQEKHLCFVFGFFFFSFLPFDGLLSRKST